VLVALGAALVLLVVLVAPVVLRGGPGSSCRRDLRYGGRTYTPRELQGARLVQAIATGVGVAAGCGASPENVDVRTLSGIPPRVAVALPTESDTVYVARGRCEAEAGRRLVACLRRD
jgi:hypothetical protein